MQTLTAALAEKDLSVWIDRSGIEEGDAYDTQIEDAIAQTRVVIVVWSQHSVKSHWVRAEAAYALGKHKLVPIAIDKSEPPLQFHHIQTIDFDGWDGTSDGEAFTRLLTVLAKRLDHAGNLGEPALAAPVIAARPKKPAALLQASIKQNWLAKMFTAGLAAAGLRFPEKVIEREFHDYFRDRTFMIAQIGFLLVLITYIIYGVSDLASEALNSTRFRYMVACPLLLAFYLLSYKNFAKQHSQLFITAFVVTLSICVYISVLLLSIETPFSIENGNGTINFHARIGRSRRHATRVRPDSPDRRSYKRAAWAHHDPRPDGNKLAQLPSYQFDVDRGLLRRFLARISDATFVRRRVVMTSAAAAPRSASLGQGAPPVWRGSKLRVDYRWAGSDAGRIRSAASGHAAAPPSAAMNVRRRIHPSRKNGVG
jgi:hypothetical protein